MIDYCAEDGIATITINRPSRLNALTPEAATILIAALDRADADPSVRVLIVTGAGKAFCAGADLEEAGAAFDDVSKVDSVERDLGGLITLRLFDMNKPVIAAVNGAAVGVGATMQLAMDVRIAASGARFGFVFVRRGLVPEAASSWFLPRIVGIATALRWCLSGSMIGADEALAAGLVSKVCEPDKLLETAREVARTMVDGTAPVSIAMTRRMLWTMLGAQHPMDAHILDSHALKARASSPDLREGIGAFLEKRPPHFPDASFGVVSDLFRKWLNPDFEEQ